MRLSSVAEVRALRALRPTLIESCLAAVLLTLSLIEALFSDEQPAPTIGRLLAAAIPPVAVAFSRVWPEGAAVALVGVLVVTALQPSESGTLGVGFSWLAISFGVAAWSRRAWPWLLLLVVSSAIRDARTIGYDATDVSIDLAFMGFTVLLGRIVHRRTAQADVLATRLDLADVDRDTATREAVARERAVIARELHDIVAHSVSLMVVQAGTARPTAQRVDRELAEVLETIEHAGREALTELRRLLHVLRSDDESDLQPLPDLTRLDSLVDGFRSAGLNLRATISPPVEVPPGVALCAYRTVQEGLTNALRYAPQGRIDVDVVGENGNLLVRVHDRGGTTTADGLGSGSGLVGLHERVLLCGGRMTAGSDQTGYLLSVTLPLPDPGLPAPAPAPVEGRSS